MIRVLVAEDSAVACRYLVHILESDTDLSVVGTAADGLEAIQLAERLRPDVILCDIHMPRMNGYDACREIMQRAPTPIILATASSNRSDARAAFDALEAGALVLVEKPVGLGHPRSADAARELIRTVKLMAEVKVVRRWRAQTTSAPSRLDPQRPPPQVVAIGASTGGPAAVAGLLRAAPGRLAFPVLLVLHITSGFTEGFVDWLASTTPHPVELAQHGTRTRSGTVYVATVGEHLGITRDGAIALSARAPENGFCPSASRLFRSVADAYGPAAIGIVLTGMGRDGADGLARLRDAGGLTIAQDERSSVVFGMPAAAIALGAAELVLPPERIATTLRSLQSRGREDA